MCRMIDLVHMELSDLTTKFFTTDQTISILSLSLFLFTLLL